MNRLAFLSLLAACLVASPCVPGKLAYAQIGPNQPGPQGDPGEDFGVDYLFEATAGTTDPGSGHLGLNDADASLATTLVLSETNADAVNVAGWLASLDDSTSTTKGQLVVRRASDSTIYRIFSVGGVVDSGTFWTLSIDLLSQNGAIVDDDGLKIAFLPTGDKGETGETGATGAAGADGKTWLSGSGAPADGSGTNGDFYLDTTAGAYYGPKAGGTWSGTGPNSLIGPTGATGEQGEQGETGPAGADGKTWHSGSGAPADGTGVNGDFYLDTGNDAYYGPKAGGTWTGTGPVSLVGPQGIQGETGPQGEQGPAGMDGSDGAAGADGRDAGWNFQFNTSTSVADPGAGKLAFNHATLSSATTLSISEQDDDANQISGLEESWDDNESAIRGYIAVHKVGSPSTFAVFGVTGSLSDSSFWKSFPVLYAVGSGTFSNNDETTVTYTPAATSYIRSGGNATSPGTHVGGDTNTGIFSDSADNLAVTTGGTERGRWSSSGLKISNGLFSGSYTTVAAASGTTNNAAPTPAMVIDVDTSAGNATWTGLSVGQQAGTVVYLIKSGANNLTLSHNSASSTATNRFLGQGGTDLTLTAAHGMVLLVYNGSNWKMGKVVP